MKATFPEKYRDRKPGPLVSETGDDYGRFFIPGPDGKVRLLVVVSGDEGWEHVSVSVIKKKRCPTWEEMCFIKNLFWEKDEAIAQFHPPEKDYVNNHEFCLHMWRPTDTELPLPPSIMVGVKGLTEQEAILVSAALGLGVVRR